MSTAFLPSIDVSDYTSPKNPGLTPSQLAYFRKVYTVLNPTNIDTAFTYLQQTTGLYETFFNVTSLSSTDDIVSLLDSGAAQVFVSQQQLKELQNVDNVDQSRVVLSADTSSVNLAAENRAVHLAKVEDAQTMQESLSKRKEEQGPIYVTVDALDGSSAALFHATHAIPILPATTLTVDSENEPDLVSAADVLMANAKSDRPDGLFTTLVTDERGIALGLVYSNEESVSESLKTGRGVYWSRKRGLWRKGETTGDVQELVNIAFDCDSDCLRFTVRQKGRGKVKSTKRD
jgi:phosphoribosyl-ATP pyrophosphohydrolase/phosphoribosyl-AMP cyclohydrolase/histidinol dehydrogenase